MPPTPETIDGQKLKEIAQMLKEDVLTLHEVAEKADLNPMYLSGLLHGLHLLNILDKKVKGATHIYRVRNEERLEELLEE